MFKELFIEASSSRKNLKSRRGEASDFPATECKKQAVRFFKTEVRRNINRYEFQLIKLTEWGFWSDSGGQYMVNMDKEGFKKVVDTLIKLLPQSSDQFIEELNDLFNFCGWED